MIVMGLKSKRALELAASKPQGARALRARDTQDRLPQTSHISAPAIIKLALLALLVCAECAPRSAFADPGCESCELAVGVGGTYHYWGTTGSLVLPVTVTWSEGRYEFGVFRFTDTQLLPLPGTHRARQMANPYWGASLSRRWQIFERGPVRGFFGFGLAGRTESDELSVTRWDFASQLGLRFRLPGNHVITEVTMRHWSNGGIKLPNHGQDFATVTIRLNSRLFGLGKEDQYAIDPTFNLRRPLAADDLSSERTALP
jgi:Lipid A 3-O-deacylase (PagL)